MVVRLGILLVHKVGIVGTHQLDAILTSQFYQHAVGLLLHGERFAVGTNRGVFHLVALQLQIVVVAKYPFVPLDSLACPGNIAVQNFPGHLAGNTSRTHNQVLMITLKVGTVGTRTHVVAVHPRPRHELNEVFIAMIVFGQHNEVVAALILTPVFLLFRAMFGHIHLATEDGLERLFTLLFEFFIHRVTVIEKLLNAEHVAMVGHGHALHAIGNSLVDKPLDARLSVEDRIIGMYVKMNEVLHVFWF